MASPFSSSRAPFGRIATAMVTPFTADGDLDLDGAQALAAYLVGAGNDALVLNGTTGEAPTTTDEEKAALRSSPGWAPTTPGTRSSRPSPPRRPERTRCWP
jgi:hypothetical protein